MANRIVGWFGVETIHIIEKFPKKLGQVPGVVQKNNISEFVKQLYVCAPIFDDCGKLVSVVSDYYVDKSNHCILVITGETNNTEGTLCLDGFVHVTDPEDALTYRMVQVVPRIDVYVSFDKKFVRINLVYNGQTLTQFKIRTQFAGNVLIL